VILCIIVSVAVSVRFWDLGEIGFNNDEAVYAGQGANMAGYEEYAQYFSIFRAHPLLFQSLVAITFFFVGLSDVAARSVAATFGVLTVVVTYLISRILFNEDVHLTRNKSDYRTTFSVINRSRMIAITSASVVALLPYHIIVSRQALVEVPFSFFFALTILMMSLFYMSRQRRWLYLVGLSAGLSFLSKEVGFLTVAASIIYIVIIKEYNIKNILAILFIFSLTISPFPIFLILTGEGAQSGSQYFQWQLSRTPNHPADFYFETIAGALGYALLALVIIAILNEFKNTRRNKTITNQNCSELKAEIARTPYDRYPNGSVTRIPGIGSSNENRISSSSFFSLRYSPIILLAVFCVVPLLFFQLLPTKGYHYLHYSIPPLVIIAVSFLFSGWMKRYVSKSAIVAIIILGFSLLTTEHVLFTIFLPSDQTFLAGGGGLPKAREAAIWVRENAPSDSVIMTIGPTMGNVIKFYSHMDIVALGIPKTGVHNPAYSPIINPDLTVRNGEVQYLIYDAYSASRTQNLGEKIKFYAEKHNAELVHIEYENLRFADGITRQVPVVMVYRIFN
jgi:hypothetical protein